MASKKKSSKTIANIPRGFKLRHTLRGHEEVITRLNWSPDDIHLASASQDGSIRIWDSITGKLCKKLSIPGIFKSDRYWMTPENESAIAWRPAWSADGRTIACGYGDTVIRLWDTDSGEIIRVFQGHTAKVNNVVWSLDCRILASSADDHTIKLWDIETGSLIYTLEGHHRGINNLALHPDGHTLASGSLDGTIRIWDIETYQLLKTLYGHEEMVITVIWSPDGQTIISSSGDGTIRLWDLAGQPDYRLVHSIFLDDIDLALLIFDTTSREKLFGGVEFWLKQLQHRHKKSLLSILVGARNDRGTPTLTLKEINNYCRRQGITGGYISTSAKDGTGIEKLISIIKNQIKWDKMPVTVTNTIFKRIKEYVLSIKAEHRWQKTLVSPDTLRKHLEKKYPGWSFDVDEMIAVVRFLQNHGYVKLLQKSSGTLSILLFPDVLINLASSFVLEARRNPEGLGVLNEALILKGGYSFPELSHLTKREQEILLNAAIRLFLENNICFRETLSDTTYLVFPSLINEKRPKVREDETFDDVSYRVSGAVENLYASLVVLLGYTNTFTRTHHWQNQAQYELGAGQVCGFRQVTEHEEEIELVLYYGGNTPEYVRSLFRGLFEKFLNEREVLIVRYPLVICPGCTERQERVVVSKQLEKGRDFVYCNNCGERISIPKTDDIVTLPLSEQKKLTEEQAIAARRTAFETVVVWVKSYFREQSQEARRPNCFISYSWGDPHQEKWVLTLAKDLQNAGIELVFDRWHNTPGTSIVKFLEKIESVDFVIAIGTKTYLKKYNTEDADPIVDAELRLIGSRLRKRVQEREKVIPLLLEGEQASSFPPQFEDSVFIDFRLHKQYFAKLFDLVLTLYEIPFDQPGVEELRESLITLSM